MEFDPQTAGLATVVAAAFAAVARWAVNYLADVFLAGLERWRIRERRRGEMLQKQQTAHRLSVGESWEDETTDIHELIDLERAKRKKRKTDRHRHRSRGERAPRPGTHHDPDDRED